jgi:hypothetical protein
MTNKETLEEVCDKVLNYLIPDCKKEMSVIQYSNAMDALKSIADWQAKQLFKDDAIQTLEKGLGLLLKKQQTMYIEEDLRNAYFSGIKTTGEGWNGEYANGNNPSIEEEFQEGFQEWLRQFKNK